MPQTLEVTVPVEIPPGYVLIKQQQLDHLTQQALTGHAWTMADLRKILGNKSEKWIKENTIWNPKFSREIKQMENDHAIIGGGKGCNYRFRASVFGPFLEQHWKEFNW